MEVDFGLPLEHGRLTPSLFARAAARANLTANVAIAGLRKYQRIFCPPSSEAEQACVLMGWSADGEVAQVIYPDLPDAEVAVARADPKHSATDRRFYANPNQV